MDPNVDIRIGSKLDAKGFKQAESATSKLNKSIKNLAGTFGLAYGTAAVVNFGKQSVKAFQEDEAAALRLSRALENLGIGFANADVSKFISDLERSAGIADDILRPAFQALLTTTGSLTQSQKLLNDAITISRGSGIDLATVSEDLAKGYVGITKGLSKYNTGLTKTELSTKSFSEILKVLVGQSAGAAADYLGTTSYQMDVLGVATSNASEIIGGGLVDAFAAVAGGSEASDAAIVIEAIATAIANVTRATGGAIGVIPTLLQKLKNLPKEIFMGFAGAQAGIKLTPKPKPEAKTALEISKEEQAKRLAKLEADAAARAKNLALLQTKQLSNAKKQAEAEKKRLLLEKAKAALTKAAATFDIDKIQLAAALKNTYDKDERLRLLAMQAIENDNGEQALAFIKQMDSLTKEQQTNKLAGVIAISETELDYINQLLLDELDRIKNTKMSEEEAAAARQAAYEKYNTAIQQSGGLADKNFYSEKTQNDLLLIAKLASLDSVQAAQTTLNIFSYTSQVAVIDRVAAAQKLADDAKLARLKDYLALAATPITPPIITPPSGPKKPEFGVGGQPLWPEGGWNSGLTDMTGAAGGVTQVVNIQIPDSATVITQSDFIDAVTMAVNEAGSYGYSLVPRGAILP